MQAAAGGPYYLAGLKCCERLANETSPPSAAHLVGPPLMSPATICWVSVPDSQPNMRTPLMVRMIRMCDCWTTLPLPHSDSQWKLAHPVARRHSRGTSDVCKV